MRVLVTGATGFLGYHVVKLLNERGVRPRVLELPGADPAPLARLDVERCAGDLSEVRRRSARPAPVSTPCSTWRSWSASAAATQVVAGDAAASTSTAPGGCWTRRGGGRHPGRDQRQRARSRREPRTGRARRDRGLVGARVRRPLRRQSRREAEQEALARATDGFAVMSVCPAFTLGPDDPVGAPGEQVDRGAGRAKAALRASRRLRLPGRAGLRVRRAGRRRAGAPRPAVPAQRQQRDDRRVPGAGRGRRRRAGAPVHGRRGALAAGRRRRRRAARAAAGEAGADRPRRPADRRALRLVRHVPGPCRARAGSHGRSSRPSRTPSRSVRAQHRAGASERGPSAAAAGGPRRGRRSRSARRSASTGRPHGPSRRSTTPPSSLRALEHFPSELAGFDDAVVLPGGASRAGHRRRRADLDGRHRDARRRAGGRARHSWPTASTCLPRPRPRLLLRLALLRHRGRPRATVGVYRLALSTGRSSSSSTRCRSPTWTASGPWSTPTTTPPRPSCGPATQSPASARGLRQPRGLRRTADASLLLRAVRLHRRHRGRRGGRGHRAGTQRPPLAPRPADRGDAADRRGVPLRQRRPVRPAPGAGLGSSPSWSPRPRCSA